MRRPRSSNDERYQKDLNFSRCLYAVGFHGILQAIKHSWRRAVSEYFSMSAGGALVSPTQRHTVCISLGARGPDGLDKVSRQSAALVTD